VARQLKKLGYGDVQILKGGLAAWASAGLPLEGKAA
jgi:rhodanese-related sulfurtransferase